MKKIISILSLLSLLSFEITAQDRVYTCNEGEVSFRSDAALEIIEAESRKLQGILNTDSRKFAFKVNVNTFQGFNSALQRIHFNENYLESTVYPAATFSGRIIEKTDLSLDGEYSIRAKGKLIIHGVVQERIIKSRVLVKNGKMMIQSKFSILLEEHDIKVPKIVHQKIAEEIFIIVNLELQTSSK